MKWLRAATAALGLLAFSSASNASLEVSCIWEAGVWASTVWEAEVWEEASCSPPAEASGSGKAGLRIGRLRIGL